MINAKTHEIQPALSRFTLCPASREPACADRIQPAMNLLRVGMSVLSRSSPAAKQPACSNHIQLTKVSPSRSYWVDQEPAYRNTVQPPHSKHVHQSRSSPETRDPACPAQILMTTSQLNLHTLLAANRAQACLDWLPTFECKPDQIMSNYQMVNLFGSYLASRKPAYPDCIQPMCLDPFHQVESQPTQIASSQLGLLTNC
jgi:hypothetical protein